MPLQAQTASVDEVAAALGLGVDKLKRTWLKLHQEHGMPRKLPTGWVWPRGALERWIDTQAAPPPEPDNQPKPAGALAAVIANENQRLRAKLGALA